MVTSQATEYLSFTTFRRLTMGKLVLRRLGVFPGSLGSYAGLDLKVPVVTIELPQAGNMPSKVDIRRIWEDLVAWLQQRFFVAPA